MAAAILTVERVRALLDFSTDPPTWRVNRTAGVKRGDVAGSLSGRGSRGYLQVKVDGRNYRVQRLAWLTAYGEWPTGRISHINHDVLDNRIENLREVSCNNDQALTVERLREVLDFSSEPPIWRIDRCNGQRAGDIAGTITPAGYRRVLIDYHLHSVHRLVWMATYGAWPKNQIDHINGVRSDNRIENLRDVLPLTNCQNQRKAKSDNRCGLLGVSSSGTKWTAQITVDQKGHYLGTFDTAEQAHAAYIEAKRRLHPGCTI